MTEKKNKVTIDSEICIGCSKCLNVCPCDSIEMIDGKAVFTKDKCMHCDHCSASCPTSAIKVESDLCQKIEFSSFSLDDKNSPAGSFKTDELVRLMLSRRSVRNYLDKKVDRDILEDLVKIGTTAPSGTNSQAWSFIVIDQDEKINEFKGRLGDFYKRLNKLSKNFILRNTLKLFGNHDLDFYYKNYLKEAEQAIKDTEENGKDPLFHHAKAIILVGSKKNASCPADDAFLATQNMLLGAHSMGLGSCLIGFASEAIKRDSSLKRYLKLDKGENIYSVIALGYPDESYSKIVGRKKITPRYL